LRRRRQLEKSFKDALLTTRDTQLKNKIEIYPHREGP